MPINQRQQLRVLMQEHLSMVDLKLICFDLDVNYEHLAGDTVFSKVMSLIMYMERQGNLQRGLNVLIRTLQEHRPRVNWPKLFGDLTIPPQIIVQEGPLAEAKLLIVGEGTVGKT